MKSILPGGLAGLVLACTSFLEIGCNSANQLNTSQPGVSRTSESEVYETPEQFNKRLVAYSNKRGVNDNKKEVDECVSIYRSIYLSSDKQKRECLDAYNRISRKEWVSEKCPFLDLKNPMHQMFAGYLNQRDKAIESVTRGRFP